MGHASSSSVNDEAGQDADCTKGMTRSPLDHGSEEGKNAVELLTVQSSIITMRKNTLIGDDVPTALPVGRDHP